nr:putative ribonuclease H-like domain-containing protein [Tanacetum cinerariifolium]
MKREILRVDPLSTAEAAYVTVHKDAAHQNILGATNNEPHGIATGLIAGETERVGFVTNGYHRNDGKKKWEQSSPNISATEDIVPNLISEVSNSQPSDSLDEIPKNIHETVGVQEHEEPTLTEVEEPTLTEDQKNMYFQQGQTEESLQSDTPQKKPPEVLKEAPSNVEQALKSEKWKNAMDVKIDALMRNGTWDKCILLQGKKDVGCRWIFTIKYKPDGDIQLSEKVYTRSPSDNKDDRLDRYQRMVGKLIYLSHTRLDISYAVGVIFTDVDWAGDKRNRRSTFGYFSLVGGNLVTWKSKKQKVVSLSSAKAELRGIAKGLAEALWIRKLVSEIGFP